MLNFLGTSDSFIPSNLSLLNGNVSHMPVTPSFFRIREIIFQVHRPPDGEKFAPRQIIPGASPIPDLGESVSPGLLSTVLLGTFAVPKRTPPRLGDNWTFLLPLPLPIPLQLLRTCPHQPWDRDLLHILKAVAPCACTFVEIQTLEFVYMSNLDFILFFIEI